MAMANEEKKIYLCRTVEKEQFETQIYSSKAVGSSRTYLKCKLSIEEHDQILDSSEEFSKKVVSSWKSSFHRMAIQAIHLCDNVNSGFLILTISNEMPIDRIDAQRIRKWGDELLKILMEYRALALENAQRAQQEAAVEPESEVKSYPETATYETRQAYREAHETAELIPEPTPEELAEQQEQAELAELAKHHEEEQRRIASLAFSENQNTHEWFTEPELDDDNFTSQPVVVQEREVYQPQNLLEVTVEKTSESEAPAAEQPVATAEDELTDQRSQGSVAEAAVPTENETELVTTASLIPRIQDELSQLLADLGDLKSSITDVKSQTEELPIYEGELEEFEPDVRLALPQSSTVEVEGEISPENSYPEHDYRDSYQAPESYAIKEKEIVEAPKSLNELIPRKEPWEMMNPLGETASVQQPFFNSFYDDEIIEQPPVSQEAYYQEAPKPAEPIQESSPYVSEVVGNEDTQMWDPTPLRSRSVVERQVNSLKIDRVLEEINNLEKFNDEWKNYQYHNKRQITKISGKVLTAHMQKGNIRINHQELISKLKSVEFISYLWEQVKTIRKEKNPIYFNDCDIETLVEDAMDFYQSEAIRYLQSKRPKLSRKIQVSNKFYLLLEAYNELKYYLENLLKENVSNPVLLH